MQTELDIDGAFALLAAVLLFAAREARAGDRQAEVWLDAFSEGTWRQWPSEPRTLLKHDRGWRESSRHKSKPPGAGPRRQLETGVSVFICATTLLIVILCRILRVIKIRLMHGYAKGLISLGISEVDRVSAPNTSPLAPRYMPTSEIPE